MIERLEKSQKNAALLGDCFLALLADDEEGDPADRRVAAIRLGEFVNLVCGALRKS